MYQSIRRIVIERTILHEGMITPALFRRCWAVLAGGSSPIRHSTIISAGRIWHQVITEVYARETEVRRHIIFSPSIDPK